MSTPDATAEAQSTTPALHRLGGRMQHAAQDFTYILLGLPIAVVSFAVLLTMSVVSISTLIIWIGALLAPVTLLAASGFAALSRQRLRILGIQLTPATYRRAGSGITGGLQILRDAQRWRDLVFEGLITFPLRLFTFVVALTWAGTALGGITYWFWAVFLPEGGTGYVELIIRALELGPLSGRGLYLAESGANLAIGAIFLLTLLPMLRGLARLDATLAVHLLGAGEESHDTATDRPSTSPADAAWTVPHAMGLAWLGIGFIAAACIAVGWPLLAALYGVNVAIAMVLALGSAGAIVLAMRLPSPAVLVGAAAGIGTIAATAGASAPWPWPVLTLLAYCLLIVVLALRHTWPWALAAWGIGAVATATSLVLAGVTEGNLANAIVFVSVTGVIVLLGVLQRLWRQSSRRAEAAEELSAEEAQRRRDLEDRNRIARELHDVVAHSMSVINVQASTARYRQQGIDAPIQQEFDDIAESSRRALGEMRSLLALLRSGDAPPTAPVPTYADIPDLIEATRASGTTITYSGASEQVPANVGLAAFRVTQEALSNALRHARGASIDVTTRLHDGTLVVQVENTATPDDVPAAPGAGVGLAGLRERVGALGGTLTAQATPSGGFRVVAHLPLDAASAAMA